jgi:RNA polymerase sigma factor (sigma-70 family)
MAASDRTTQQELYEKYAPMIYRRCLRYLRSKEEAQDATSEVFLKLLEHWDSVQNRESALFWIHRTTTNHCISLWRRKKFQGPDNEDGWEDSPLHADDSEEKRIILRDILSKLMMPWSYWDGYTQDEISTMTGIAPSTIRKHLTKFRRQTEQWKLEKLEGQHAY